MKFLGNLLYEDSSAIDFGPDRSIPQAGHALKVRQRNSLIELKLQGHVRVFMGHCVESIFVAIRQPVYKIIK